jgi:fermentation-respiration switch protein FrsA (DUF1100 family)
MGAMTFPGLPNLLAFEAPNLVITFYPLARAHLRRPAGPGAAWRRSVAIAGRLFFEWSTGSGLMRVRRAGLRYVALPIQMISASLPLSHEGRLMSVQRCFGIISVAPLSHQSRSDGGRNDHHRT